MQAMQPTPSRRGIDWRARPGDAIDDRALREFRRSDALRTSRAYQATERLTPADAFAGPRQDLDRIDARLRDWPEPMRSWARAWVGAAVLSALVWAVCWGPR